MFATFCRRRLRFPSVRQFWVPENAVMVKTFSSGKPSPGVCENVSEKSFAVSYLINSCGLSSKDAISVSNKVCFKSPEKPDAVLELLREYGFTDANISKLVARWPDVLAASPDKNLLPKLDFFRSIGVPLPVLAQNLSVCPFLLRRSLKNSIIPDYNQLKNLLRSDKGVVHMFSNAIRIFSRGWTERSISNISVLREKGVPESSIVYLVMRQPILLIISKEKLAAYVDRAVQMGFDMSKSGFVHAVKVFVETNESTLKHKMEVYRRFGWSESDIVTAFLRFPNCLKFSEKKITANIDFLVNELGLKHVDIVRSPVLLGYSLENRIKPRCLVAEILNEKGLKKAANFITLFSLSEKKFLMNYIFKYQKDIPQLLAIYQGNLKWISVEK